MSPTISESSLKEVQDDYRAEDNNVLRISTMEKGLLNNANLEKEGKVMGIPSRLRLPKFNLNSNLVSASEKFRGTVKCGEVSHHVPSLTDQGLRECVERISSPKLGWASMIERFKIWMKNPLNMAIFLWISCVAVSGAILFLVMTGMLNHVLPKKSQRDTWFEVNNQILNALFTLMCLYQHPRRFHHLVCLCRWKPEDVSTLRKAYCKNSTYKPCERAHIAVVIGLLHVNCFAQYALCGLNFGYKSSERPAAGVGICLSMAIAAPAIAGVYCIMSPLGKEYEFGIDEEAQDQNLTIETARSNHLRMISTERRLSCASRNEQKIVETMPEWRGGLFDLCDDGSVSCLSLFCGFCVLGWNMERLGFGNKYVHTATFFLFCTAPYCIFNLAATKIYNETISEAFGITGIVLCVFGLLYGGFWRIQMRKRFELPANYSCCGRPAVTDCAQWLFCCWCSLAQEVRTATFYDTVEDKYCRWQVNKNGQPDIFPLPHEDGAQFGTFGTSIALRNSPKLSMLTKESSESPEGQLSNLENGVVDDFMNPPIPLALQKEYQSERNIC